jgi:hypothetical protein
MKKGRSVNILFGLRCRSIANAVTVKRSEERVGAVFGHDAIGLRLFGLVLGLQLVSNGVVLLGQPFLSLQGGDAARSCSFCQLL